MKRIFLAIMLLILTVTPIMAGNIVGLKGGLNIATVKGDDIADGVSTKTGFNLGAFFMIPVNEILTIQPEILYSSKGYTGTTDKVANLNYLEIPVLLKFSFGEGVKPSIFVGPYLSMLLSADYNGSDVKDSFESTDFGIVIGAGIDIDMGDGVFTIDGRYSLGLSNNFKPVLGTTFDAKNANISISIGYGVKF